MLTSITLNGNTVSLVAMPPSSCLAQVQFDAIDAVALDTAPYTGWTQAQAWLGADMWTGTVTLPPLSQAEADVWISALMECRGRLNPFQLGDPMKVAPSGNPLGTPTCPATPVDVAGNTVLHTVGWTPSKVGLLLPGDYLQVGYRLHRLLGIVNSDDDGNAAISVWPSLREAPVASAPIVLANPRGLFRLATDKRTWSADTSRATRISFQVMEYR